MNIITLLNQVKDGETVLPAIQRDFVWGKDKIVTLLDSIMRGYPVGIALLWETYAEIPYREFVKDYKPDGRHTFKDNNRRQKLRVVLDGQQRLQSLFVALYGSYDGQLLYFDLLSGRSGDDFSQQRFIFRFSDANQVQEWNKAVPVQNVSQFKLPTDPYERAVFSAIQKGGEVNALAKEVAAQFTNDKRKPHRATTEHFITWVHDYINELDHYGIKVKVTGDYPKEPPKAVKSERSSAETIGQLAGKEDGFVPEYFVSVATLFGLGVSSRQKLRKDLVKMLGLNDEDELRVESNLARFDEVLTKNENLLKASVIDENLPSDSPDRKSEADVLEIFVRINRQGSPLSRSDLIFSILKLRWKESAQALPDFVREINAGNSLDLDTDFVIRCLFAVCDLGTRFDLELLRSQSKVDLMRNNFKRCCEAIKSTIDFIVRDCWCQSSGVIGGDATLIPFVYYVFHQSKLEVPNNQTERVRKSFYLVGFTQPFSRYADSRLGTFLRQELKPLRAKGDTSFPFERLMAWIKYWERVQNYGTELLQANHTLALHLIQKHTGAKILYSNNSPEIDHIFPRSVLREKEFDNSKIEHPANFWILAKGKNGNKSNKHPADYFADVPASEMKRAFIDREMLDYRRYTSFLEQRGKAMLEAITKEIGLCKADFESDE